MITRFSIITIGVVLALIGLFTIILSFPVTFAGPALIITGLVIVLLGVFLPRCDGQIKIFSAISLIISALVILLGAYLLTLIVVPGALELGLTVLGFGVLLLGVGTNL